VEITKAALEEGTPAKSVLNDGLIAGMDVVGARFKKNEVYIPEVLIAAVQGDLHDIGKNLVAMMLKGAGFQVIDLGVDVGPDKFVEQSKAQGVQVVGMSALLTTTMPGMEKAIKAIKDAGVSAKIMIGGAPVTQGYADKIGADGYAADAASAVDIAKTLVA
jgi:5-methyltetrahydrofolate--homocysteine methyltransferase